RRIQDPPQSPDTIRQYLATAGPVASDIKAVSYLSLTMDIAEYRAQAATRLVRDARTQLPNDATGLIFIEAVGHRAALGKLRPLLAAPTYHNTPWVSVWMHGECLDAVWRESQPFDGSVLVPG